MNLKKIELGSCRLNFARLFVMVALMDACWGCGPGRSGGKQRIQKKLKPLVFKQHVPNVPEKTLGASGPNEGRISRADPKFRDLVPNYNSDIIFKDEEGTGEDRLMTQRCKERLNTLAVSVMNLWPGVRLRVIESWDSEGLHHSDSLHYEGRAVDITTSDRDSSKYGMLARLAVEAGFDWVYYESRSHVHCSVKSESSQAAKSMGCFTGKMTVLLANGSDKLMSDLEIGDRVLTLNDHGNLEYSDVLLFMHHSPDVRSQFLRLKTASGHSLTITPEHLILRWQKPRPTSLYDAIPVYARDVRIGDKLLIQSQKNRNARSQNDSSQNYGSQWNSNYSQNSNQSLQSQRNSNYSSQDSIRSQQNNEKTIRNALFVDRVISIEVLYETGVYAPLTATGTIVVNEFVASCYAVIDSQFVAHLAFAPVRAYAFARRQVLRAYDAITMSHDARHVVPQSGIHWYCKVLQSISDFVVPSSWMAQ